MIGEPDEAPEPRRPRWGRRITAVGLLLAVTSPLWARPLLSRMEFFRVRRIEVRNARFTPPEEIRKRLEIDTTFSIWNDLEPLQRRIAEHPQVSEVRLSRRFPSTLVVTVEEHQPVALVQGRGGLQAYDATGRALPLDPSRTPVDVPLAARADTTLLRFLGQLQAVDRHLFARVNEVRRVSKDEVLLDLIGLSVRVRPDITVERLAQISSVEAELSRRQSRPRELDFRFRDQVIARFP
ncbi:MAG TPA: FtsQ-type POTRA domain-containing protein [Gemmatimonadaceae bacterium]